MVLHASVASRHKKDVKMSSNPAIPVLENGDRVSRREFERRYDGMLGVKKAELIEGQVWMPSPVRFTSHAQPHAFMIGWLFNYVASTPGVRLADNASVRLDADNEFQPDALLFRQPGPASVAADDYLEGAPELVVEIAGSSAAIDLHEKKHVYQRVGVREYIVWQVHERKIDWFVLTEDGYVTLPPDEQGILSSRTFAGLCLAVEAMLSGDLAKVLAAMPQSKS
jgi:Uma2 family endonuclease